MSYKKRRAQGTTVATASDVTNIDLGDIGAADTFTLTPTRVDTATAGSATDAITYDATEATLTAAIQTAVRALGGIYADATVANGTTAAHKDITVLGGYDVTWAIDDTGFTAGGVTETTPGASAVTLSIPVGVKARVLRLTIPAVADASVDIDISDSNGDDVYVKTGVDLSSGFDDFLAVDGKDDVLANVEVGPGFFEGPLTAVVTSSVPDLDVTVEVVCDMPFAVKRFLTRSTGAVGNSTTSLNLGREYAVIKRLDIVSTADASVDVTIADGDGKTVFVKTGIDADPEIRVNVATDAVLQDGSASADGGGGEMVCKSPVDITIANCSTGTVRVKCQVEA